MLLAIDIGNTNIHYGLFKGKKLAKVFIVPSYRRELYIKSLRPYLKKIDRVVVASVAPKVLREVLKILKGSVTAKILVVGRSVDSGVKNLYKNPKQVGQDRLVNARAMYELYGGPGIIVDFGTAITIDIVTKNKAYIGGIIAPGVEISTSVLSERAALLPKVKLRRPKDIIGKETTESMISGAVYGFAGLCDGIVQRFRDTYAKDAVVIATGGMSRLIGPYCKTVNRIDPELTLKGLRIIGEDQGV